MEKINNVGFYIFFVEFFTYPWEQRKLGEVGYTYTGLSGKTKKDFGFGDAKYVTYLNVFNNTIAKKNQLDSITIDKSQNSIKYGDVFFTTSSETPDEVGMSSIWLYNFDNIYLNSFCFGFRPTITIDPYFLAYSLRSYYIRKQFNLLAQGISRYNISKTKAMDIFISLPEVKEQKKIGNHFKMLDNQITLHQCEPILKSNLIQIIIS
ncbi:restriction endonuclease subunit S [Microaceticoccus formicicus]|uniref:restriction endonuclease subunit S n=1 Tax=Microaceticoccus formicicus TaxID=3118105 RepID=UPI003CD030BC|nr:restriction endonuclease subunit S [Peptoniphilaceae bacterium AMB_02]